MKTLKIICIILGVLLVIECGVGIFFQTHKRLDYVEFEGGKEYLDREGISFDWDNETCKQAVDELFGNPKYTYIEVPFNRSFCIAVFRLVGINQSLSNVFYIQDLAHELVHLTEFVGNERYTEYRSFVILYESDVPELHEAGRRLAISHYYSKENGGAYDCWYYINKYLKEKNQ